MVVLDASALLALLFEEPGYRRVAVAADGACISTVNLTEVLTRFMRDGHPAATVLAQLETYAIEWARFDETHAAQVAMLWRRIRRADLSLADRASLALAIDRELPVLTADRAWVALGLPVEIELIR